jgi:peptidyl-prolyl cis-trans isomerase C
LELTIFTDFRDYGARRALHGVALMPQSGPSVVSEGHLKDTGRAARGTMPAITNQDRRMVRASINGREIAAEDAASLRTRLVQELLRQQAIAEGLMEENASEEATEAALEALLERHVPQPEVSEEAVLAHYARHAARFRQGESVMASHILLHAPPDEAPADVVAQAEALLGQVLAQPMRFEAIAREYSNCPSAQLGGTLGQLLRGETSAEMEAALFGDDYVGIRPHLVRSPMGYHVVRIDQREIGRPLSLEQASARIRAELQEAALADALQAYVGTLMRAAQVRELD